MPAVSEHVLIAVSNTVMPATAPVLNAGRHINEGDAMLLVEDHGERLINVYSDRHEHQSSSNAPTICLNMLHSLPPPYTHG